MGCLLILNIGWVLFKDIIIHYKTLVIPNGYLGIEVSNISFRSPPPGCYNTNLFHEVVMNMHWILWLSTLTHKMLGVLMMFMKFH